MMTAAQCLTAAARVETLAHDLYRILSERFFHEPYLRDLFSRLADEEGQHAMRIHLLVRYQSSSAWTRDVTERAVAALDAAEAGIDGLRGEFEASPGRLDPRTVLRRVAEVETQFNAVHAEDLAGSSDPTVRHLFVSLAEQDSQHLELIRKAMKQAVA
jgi:rubrerythrin